MARISVCSAFQFEVLVNEAVAFLRVLPADDAADGSELLRLLV
ncbi:hypothetical protein [Haladaptatus halobius]|nr:hypothetical protein [Haladaptatus halobius]